MKKNLSWPYFVIATERPLVFVVENDDTMKMMIWMMWTRRMTTMTRAKMVIRSLDLWAVVVDELMRRQSLRSLRTFFFF